MKFNDKELDAILTALQCYVCQNPQCEYGKRCKKILRRIMDHLYPVEKLTEKMK